MHKTCLLILIISIFFPENQNHSDIFEDSLLQDIEEIKEMERAKSHSHGRHFMDQHGGHFDTSFYTEYTGQSYLTGAHAVEIAPDTIIPPISPYSSLFSPQLFIGLCMTLLIA